MINHNVLHAINESQDGHPLVKFFAELLAGTGAEYTENEEWTTCLNRMIVHAYSQAGDAGELLNHLRYATEQIRLAAEAVRPFANAEEEAAT